jgi:hypothetical protein
MPTFTLFITLRHEVSTDDGLCALCVDIMAGTCSDKWQLQDGLITVAGKVYVPPTSPSLAVVLGAAHGAAHEGVA